MVNEGHVFVTSLKSELGVPHCRVKHTGIFQRVNDNGEGTHRSSIANRPLNRSAGRVVSPLSVRSLVGQRGKVNSFTHISAMLSLLWGCS